MKTTRRGFFGAMALPFILKLDPKKHIENKYSVKPIAPKAEERVLLPNDWYTVQVVDVFERESRLDGSPVYGLVLRTKDGQEVQSMFSSKALHFAVPALSAIKLIKADEDLSTQRVDLADAIGKEMRVHIEEEEYNKKKFNVVSEYLALE